MQVLQGRRLSSGRSLLVLGFLEPRAGERLGDLVVVHGLGQQAVLDGVLLDVLLDGAGGFFGRGGQLVDLGLLVGEVAGNDERRRDEVHLVLGGARGRSR